MAQVLFSQRQLQQHSPDPQPTTPVPARSAGEQQDQDQQQQLSSVLALLLALLRKSLVGCRTGAGDIALPGMEIGWPTDVRHVVHVTFDRFHGFLGLPVELETHVPPRAPSASASVFGVSTESMQCSYDARGNSVPTILLLMQRRLYEQGGLRAEGIFRINAENSQEEFVRDRLNHGVVPDGIDVHCLAGLIKAWFRELPKGVLDTIPPEQVMQCQSEEDCVQVAKLLPQTEAALLEWAVNLMADVVQEEHLNKMNARNIAMVFAPNMTQMSDPLTALMYAVQVMNFLKMLIEKTLKERQDPSLEDESRRLNDPSDENDHQSSQLPIETCENKEAEQEFMAKEQLVGSPAHSCEETCAMEDIADDSRATAASEETLAANEACNGSSASRPNASPVNLCRSRTGRAVGHKRARKSKVQSLARAALASDKSKGATIVSRLNTKAERIEAWR